MNKYIRIAVCVPTGIIKSAILKVTHGSGYYASIISAMSPCSEITLDRGGILNIGSHFRIRGGAKLRIRKGAKCIIGNNVSINHNCMIVCHESIVIGDDVQFSPNVLIYDHDHDYTAPGGVKSMQYKTRPIKIGNNVWIGANTVILQGTQIGANSVIGAGCIIKGIYPSESVIVQKRSTDIMGN